MPGVQSIHALRGHVTQLSLTVTQQDAVSRWRRGQDGCRATAGRSATAGGTARPESTPTHFTRSFTFVRPLCHSRPMTHPILTRVISLQRLHPRSFPHVRPPRHSRSDEPSDDPSEDPSVEFEAENVSVGWNPSVRLIHLWLSASSALIRVSGL